MSLRVVSAIMFSPRGGSAHVARALARGLRENDCQVTLVAGSRSDLGPLGDARTFYGDVQPVDFDAALAGGAPMRYEGPPGTAPLHPSFEERPGAPDTVFAKLDDLDYERQVRAWSRELAAAGAAGADVLHLHHLTPLNEAAARIARGVPIAGQLHGTELLMLERIDEGPPPGWEHAARWSDRLRGWAQQCACLLVAPAGIDRAVDLLGVARDRFVTIPNGFDGSLFAPHDVDRGAFWRRALVERPQGSLPGREPGSARYGSEEIARLAAGAVLLYVGRFTAVKRLDVLIAAFWRAQQRLGSSTPVSLVLVGGHPGECEGEHPAEIAARLQVPNVFLAGWQEHEHLAGFFSAADAVVIASQREQFGQVLVEGMACGLPAIATRSMGPASIVDDGRTGWLAPAGDEEALAAAIVDAVEHPQERARRGRAARAAVCERFSWAGIAVRLAEVLSGVAGAAGSGAAGSGAAPSAPAARP